MRVLILASWYPDENKPLNGVFFKEQAEALENYGLDVVVLNINLASIINIINVRTPIGLTIKNENNIKVYRCKSYNFFPRLYKSYIKYYSYLIKKCIKKIEKEEGKIDLIHIHSAFDAGIAYAESKINIPYLITEHSSRYHRGVINRAEEEMLYNAFSKASKVISVGKGLAEKIKIYCKNEVPVIIPNMVTINNNKIETDLKKKKFRFFSLAFLNTYKGMDILIEAFNYNKDILDSIELYIGGDGPEKENLEKLICKYRLEKSIYLLGELNRKQVEFHMNNCDAFVLASRVETFGIVFIEAMSKGKPVIGTKTGGPDTFINEKVGITVEVDNTEELVKAIKYIYKNYDKYDSNYIKEYCKRTFSAENISKKLNTIYNEVIGDING